VRTDGTVLAWGWNNHGQLGNGSITGNNPNPNPGAVTFPPSTVITLVSAGAYTSGAVSTTNAVYGWGNNGSGQLGIGNTVDQASVVLIPIPPPPFPAPPGCHWGFVILVIDHVIIVWGWVLFCP
jgi:alpha-tubulin suppressor-like RCC1 family protein